MLNFNFSPNNFLSAGNAMAFTLDPQIQPQPFYYRMNTLATVADFNNTVGANGYHFYGQLNVSIALGQANETSILVGTSLGAVIATNEVFNINVANRIDNNYVSYFNSFTTLINNLTYTDGGQTKFTIEAIGYLLLLNY